jgi:bis(5'-nucleosidyl)-tetraphosphatase
MLIIVSMPKLERSAGFVLFRSDESAPGGRVFLLLDYGRHWDYAKGHVEPGESDYDAAVRELREETGIADPVRVGQFAHEIEYYFRGKNGMIRKQVVFFIGQTKQDQVVISHEHVGYLFLPFETALSKLTYPSAKAVLRAAQAYLLGMT